MKTKITKVLLTISLLFAFTITINADTITKTIEVTFNSVNLAVNGEKVDADTIAYNGTTYVPLRAVAEMLGEEVSWNGDTHTANIGNTPVDTTVSNDDAYKTEEQTNFYDSCLKTFVRYNLRINKLLDALEQRKDISAELSNLSTDVDKFKQDINKIEPIEKFKNTHLYITMASNDLTLAIYDLKLVNINLMQDDSDGFNKNWLNYKNNHASLEDFYDKACSSFIDGQTKTANIGSNSVDTTGSKPIDSTSSNPVNTSDSDTYSNTLKEQIQFYYSTLDTLKSYYDSLAELIEDILQGKNISKELSNLSSDLDKIKQDIDKRKPTKEFKNAHYYISMATSRLGLSINDLQLAINSLMLNDLEDYKEDMQKFNDDIIKYNELCTNGLNAIKKINP